VSGPSSATLSIKAASALEALTGLGLVVAPSLLARLLFGSEMAQVRRPAASLAWSCYALQLATGRGTRRTIGLRL
jgi:hypothetical protein